MMTDNKQKNIIKLWQICLVFLFWIGAMFLPATINQIKFGTNFDLAKSRENYFFYLWVQKPVTSTLLILLLLWIILSCLRKWKITPFLSFSFMLLYIYDLFLEFVLGRNFYRTLAYARFRILFDKSFRKLLFNPTLCLSYESFKSTKKLK